VRSAHRRNHGGVDSLILRLVIVGFGNVGQEFARLLLSKRDWLLKNKGLDIEVLAIATKSRGSLFSNRALDLERVLGNLKDRGTLHEFGPENTPLTPLEIIGKSDADMMIELTTLNIETGQPAIDHIRSAFNMSMDVVTANKGPVAYAYKDLRNMARSRGVHFRFEGTVMDGTPVFNLVERTLPGCEVTGLEGILNSTTNFVLAKMNSGMTMESAIGEAKSRGIAEADPTLDIDGWDASAKIAALANVLMEAETNPKKVARKGISELTKADIDAATRKGKKIKLVASAKRTGESVDLSVSPQTVGPDSPFWSVDGVSSALTIKTDLMGDLTIIEGSGEVSQTAYAIFSDLILTVEAIRNGTI
jgi:homoserine dehydrogenase